MHIISIVEPYLVPVLFALKFCAQGLFENSNLLIDPNLKVPSVNSLIIF